MSAVVNENTCHTSKIYERSRSIAIELLEKIASTSIGQTLLKNSDNLLWVIEKSTQWFMPVESELTDSKNGKHAGTKIIRPLPWLLFIPMLLFLRISKMSINIGMFLLGLEPVQATSVIKYLHLQRRKIRSMRISSQRKVDEQKVQNKTSVQRDHSESNWREFLLNKLLNTFCLSRTNYEQIKQNETELFIYKEKIRKERNEEISSPESSDYEPLLDKNTMEILRKFASRHSNSDTDPDYKDEEELLTEDSFSEQESNENINDIKNSETNYKESEKSSVEINTQVEDEKSISCEKRKTENELQSNVMNNIYKFNERKQSDLETLYENSNVKESNDSTLNSPDNSTKFVKHLDYNVSLSNSSKINCNAGGSYDVLEKSSSDNLTYKSVLLDNNKEISASFNEELKSPLNTNNKSDCNYSNLSPETSSNNSNVKEKIINFEQNESNISKNISKNSGVATKSCQDEKVSHLLESTLKNGTDVNVDIVKEVLKGKNRLNKKSKYHKRKAVHRFNNRK